MSRSSKLFARAREVIPGGVNSPVRAFSAVGGDPPFIARGEGNYLFDEEGHRYLDLVSSWGPLILGHADPLVLGAVTAAIARGSSFGAPTGAEVELAELIVEMVPSVEMVRLCSSGTEATMHAIRLARGATGRDLIIKMVGCYHGAHDAVLVAAGSGLATFGTPSSPGVPAAVAANTLLAPFNSPEAVAELFRVHSDRIAAVILEPIAGNMGVIPPEDGYLQSLRDLCDQHGSVLIFDEVMCGFRVGTGTAQELYGVRPDLTCFGKIVGGGFPLAAFGGRADLMGQLAPAGPIYQAGTLSGNPVAVAAGLATLKQLDAAAFERMEEVGAALEKGMRRAVTYHGDLSFSRVGSMFTLFYRSERPINFAQVEECNLDEYSRYFRASLANGVYLPPSQFESVFLSPRLTDQQVEQIVEGLSAAIVVAEM